VLQPVGPSLLKPYVQWYAPGNHPHRNSSPRAGMGFAREVTLTAGFIFYPYGTCLGVSPSRQLRMPQVPHRQNDQLCCKAPVSPRATRADKYDP
jgi:hypothetical protein